MSLEPTQTGDQWLGRHPMRRHHRLFMQNCPSRRVTYGQPLFIFDQTRCELVEWWDNKACEILGPNSIIISRSPPVVIGRCDNNTKFGVLDGIMLNQSKEA